MITEMAQQFCKERLMSSSTKSPNSEISKIASHLFQKQN